MSEAVWKDGFGVGFFFGGLFAQALFYFLVKWAA